ncbi:MAG: hypothetical protein MUF00_12645, partial [Gemmatimonadaceae bacterium]|nr:hypothetical protein [Gemmatimonadaceae bacterium]
MSAIRVRVRLLSLAHGARRVGALTALAPWVAGGVELRAQSATAHSASWTVAPPRVVVGTAPDGVDRFLSIAGATALPGGTIVVVDRDAPAVVFIGPDGRVRRRVGRSGSGPGEYRSPELIGACAPGRVFVFDRMQQRVTVLDTAGRVERSQVLTAEPAALACHARSGIALMRMPQGVAMPDANGNAPPLSTRVLMLSPAFDSLGASPAFDAGEARPMGRIARIAVGPSGFFVGTQQSPQIARYSVAGVPRGTVRAGVVGRAPTRAHQDAVIEQLVAPM